MKVFTVCVLTVTLGGCMSLPGGGTGLDPKFLDGVKSVLTDTACGHHDEFRATVGAAGIPASTTIVAVRDCPTPIPGVPVLPTPTAAGAAAVGLKASPGFD